MSEMSAEAIPNQYVVVFKHHTPEDARQEHYKWAQSAHNETTALHAASGGPELTGVGEQFNIETMFGYFGCFDEDLKNEIESKEEVDFVEPDYKVYPFKNVTQKPVPAWGLARISRNIKIPIPLPDDVGYTYDATAGAGTWAYVLDSGILITHVDFGGRAKWGTNTVPNSSNTDKDGHGTCVAGIIGGSTYGVAKKCNLIAVKVLDDEGNGNSSTCIKGIEWAVKDAKNNGRIKKSVANMSWGSERSEAINKAAAAAVNAGLTVIVAAGNKNTDACKYSPASEPLAYTVGSIDTDDTKAEDSNYGKCLDIFAPGVGIRSDWCEPGNDGEQTSDGTSVASPHVAGLALTLIAKDPTKYSTPTEITKGISALATKNTKVSPSPPSGTTFISYNGL